MIPLSPNEALLEACARIGLRNFSVNGVLKMQEFFVAKVKQALEGGATPSCRDANGNDPITLLSRSLGQDTAAATRSAKLLIDHGYPVSDRAILNQVGEGRLQEEVMLHLNRKMDQGETYLSRGGNSLLHDLCSNAGLHLPRLMGCLKSKSRPVHLLTQDNVNAQNKQGDTPAHLLWRSYSKAGDKHAALWDAMEFLFSFDADMGIRNKAGVSAFESMLAAMEEGVVPRSASHSKLWFDLQAKHLGVATTPATSTPSRALRL